MPLTTVWFIPGFMGSTLGLYNVGPNGQRGSKVLSLWGNLQAIPALPLIQVLALPSTPPPGTAIFADGLSPSVLGGYTNFAQNLSHNLPAGFTLATWPYDWRLSARTLGANLANQLIANVGLGNSNILVAHSYGALVAWLAWAALVDSQQTAALSRTITFGGALYGASATPGIFLENETSLGQLAALQQLAIGNVGGAVGQLLIGGPTDAQVKALLDCAATWPAVYDLYPDQGNQDDPGDTQRALAFTQSAWTAALSQPVWATLNAEVAAVHQYVRQPKYVPPLTQVVNILSGGYQTPYRVQPSQQSLQGPGAAIPPPARSSATLLRRWQLPSWSNTAGGDARCTVAQSSWPGAKLVLVGSQHAAMQDDPSVLVAIIAYLEGTIVPPMPVTASEHVFLPPPTTLDLSKLDLAIQQIQSQPNPTPLPPWATVFGIVEPQPNVQPQPPVIPIRSGVDP